MRKRAPRFQRTLGCCAAVPMLMLVLAFQVQAAGLAETLRSRKAANDASIKSQQKIDGISDQTDKLADDYRQVLKQTESLRIYNAQISTLIASQDAEAESLREQIDNVELVARAVVPLMLQMIESLDAFVKLDVPFLLDERTTRVAALRDLMRRSDVTDSERYRRIMEAYQIENDFGRTIEAYEGEVEIEGRTQTVDFLRFGRIALLYQTRDAARTGAWDGQTGGFVDLPGSYRNSVRQGLRIARKQVAPNLLRLPIPGAEDIR